MLELFLSEVRAGQLDAGLLAIVLLSIGGGLAWNACAWLYRRLKKKTKLRLLRRSRAVRHHTLGSL